MLTALAIRFLALPQWARNALYGLGIAILSGVLFMAWLWHHDRKVLQREQAKREAAASDARDKAADERVKDAVANTANEKDLHDAIQAAPTGGALSPASHALACERLRKLGRVPAACGPTGGN